MSNTRTQPANPSGAPVPPREKLERLLREQAVAPVDDLDALGRQWPGQDDAADLIVFVEQERAARHAAAEDEDATR